MAAERKSSRDRSRVAPKDYWRPELVGVAPMYPRSAEAFAARQARGRAVLDRLAAEGRRPNRKNVRDGWGNRKAERISLQAQAKTKAQEAMARLIEAGTVVEAAADAALRVAFEIICDETENTGDRLKAIKSVTDALKPKPTQKVEATVSVAEKWLAQISSARQL